MVPDMDDFNPWTQQGAQDLLEAGEALAQAVRTHASTLVGLIDTRDDEQLFNANDALLPVVLAYADAQAALTGTYFPFGSLKDYADEDDADEWDENEEDVFTADGAERVSVIGRWDVLVRDASSLQALALERLRAQSPGVTIEADDEHCDSTGSALLTLIEIDGVARYPGVEEAGSEYSVGAVAKTLFEMSPEERRAASLVMPPG
jgi:hypothetical protein